MQIRFKFFSVPNYDIDVDSDDEQVKINRIYVLHHERALLIVVSEIDKIILTSIRVSISTQLSLIHLQQIIYKVGQVKQDIE